MFNSYRTIQAHPWHGITVGANAPREINAFIELIPLDTAKYEIDKLSGHLKLDRPHKYSSLCPTLYGFIPQTFCGQKVAELAAEQYGGKVLEGDKDPLDICVLTEITVTRSSILVNARPVGGFRVLDSNEVDDKIISVLVNDPVYGHLQDLNEVPPGLVNRLKHYFLTYKALPEESSKKRVEISDIYGVDEAYKVINKAIEDYQLLFQNNGF